MNARKEKTLHVLAERELEAVAGGYKKGAPGGKMGLGGLFPPVNINIDPTIVTLNQINVGAAVALFGGSAGNGQGNGAGVAAK